MAACPARGKIFELLFFSYKQPTRSPRRGLASLLTSIASTFCSICARSFVPESVLKKRKGVDELRKKALAARAVEKKAAKEKRYVACTSWSTETWAGLGFSGLGVPTGAAAVARRRLENPLGDDSILGRRYHHDEDSAAATEATRSGEENVSMGAAA